MIELLGILLEQEQQIISGNCPMNPMTKKFHSLLVSLLASINSDFPFRDICYRALMTCVSRLYSNFLIT